MPTILSSEFFRLRHRLLVRVMLLAVMAITVGVYVLQSSPAPNTEAGTNLADLRLANAPDFGLAIVYQLVVVTTMVLAASTIATEYGWGTIRTVLSRTRSRTSFFAAKVVSVLAFALLVLVLGTATAYLSSYGISLWKDLGTAPGADAAERFALGPVRILAAALPYIALAFMVALWSRTTAAGFGAVVIAFYLDVLLGPLFEAGAALSWVPEDALIWQNVSALLDANSLDATQGTPEAWAAAAVLLAYAGIFTAIAYWRFLTRDVLSS